MSTAHPMKKAGFRNLLKLMNSAANKEHGKSTRCPGCGKSTRKRIPAVLIPALIPAFCVRAGAADTIWTKANAIMKDIYLQVLGISTVAAVVTASIALLLMNFSRSGRTVDESRAWLKRIVVTWAVLNSLGLIMAYITPFFSGGAWS